MKKIIIVTVLAVFSAQAIGAVRGEVKRGEHKPGMTKEEKARQEAKTAENRGAMVETGHKRAVVQTEMDQKAMAADLVVQGRSDKGRCNEVCVSTLETIESLVQEPSKYENDAASKATVDNLLLKINQEVVAGNNMGTAVDKAAAQLGVEPKELVEACR